MTPSTTDIEVTVRLAVVEHTWAAMYGAGDAYDAAQAQRSRSLVADVRDYALAQILQSAAALEGAIYTADLVEEEAE